MPRRAERCPCRHHRAATLLARRRTCPSPSTAEVRPSMNPPEQLEIAEVPSTARIATIESLREHLQWAIELEHATLPPYLCALYSLEPSRNPDAVQVIAGVFVEEMIHLSLAANL